MVISNSFKNINGNIGYFEEEDDFDDFTEAVETSEDEGIDSMEQIDIMNNSIDTLRTKSEIKLSKSWQRIIEKYGDPELDSEADVIDLYSGEIVEDHGHLRGLDEPEGSLWEHNLGEDEEKIVMAEKKRKLGGSLDSSPSKKISKGNESTPVKSINQITSWLLNNESDSEEELVTLMSSERGVLQGNRPQIQEKSPVTRHKIEISSSPIRLSRVPQFLEDDFSENELTLQGHSPTKLCGTDHDQKCSRPFCFKCS